MSFLWFEKISRFCVFFHILFVVSFCEFHDQLACWLAGWQTGWLACTGLVLVLYWSCTGLVLVLYWSCTGLVLVLYWSCTGLALVLLVLLVLYWSCTVLYLYWNISTKCPRPTKPQRINKKRTRSRELVRWLALGGSGWFWVGVGQTKPAPKSLKP